MKERAGLLAVFMTLISATAAMMLQIVAAWYLWHWITRGQYAFVAGCFFGSVLLWVLVRWLKPITDAYFAETEAETEQQHWQG